MTVGVHKVGTGANESAAALIQASQRPSSAGSPWTVRGCWWLMTCL